MQGRRILVVEDDADFGSSLRDILVTEGYDVAIADSRDSAIAETERFAPGVALIDLRLGSDDGIEVMTVLRARRQGLQCVLMTAFASIETVIAALQRQADDYLTKPFHPDDLFMVLGRCFDRIARDRRATEARQALRESEERFSNLLEVSSQGVLVHRAGRPLYVNPKLAEIFGYDSRDELLALDTLAPLFGPGDWMRIAAGEGDAGCDPAAAPDADLRGLRRDGAHLRLEHRCFALPWEGTSALCSLLFDVTERRKTEEQLRQSQRMEAIGNLTGGIAHDFNNLLTIMMGNAQLLREWGIGKDKRAGPALDSIIRAARRGADLTQRLLAFSRRQPLTPKTVNLNAMVRGMENILIRTLGEHVDVETCTAAGLWHCKADPGQVENAIVNLAVNARDAMPAGGKLTIATANATLDDDDAAAQLDLEPGDYVMLSVTDSGTGMPEEVRRHIFEPFFTTKETGKGTGLGLSMVYGFVKQSGGHVTCVSAEGEGASFRIYLPRSMAAVELSGAAPESGAGARGEAVLVVEDDADVRALTAAMLTEFGYEVTDAGSAAAALAIVDGGAQVDLLCTDVILPNGQDGCDLADEIVALRPDARVLYMSGYTDDALLRPDRFEDGVPLLRKPFGRDVLRVAVRAALDGEATPIS